MNESLPFDIDQLKEFVSEIPGFQNKSIYSIQNLAGDGSGRTFYRMKFDSSSELSAVLLVQPEIIGPPLECKRPYIQKEAVIELGKFFYEHKIPVPLPYGSDFTKGWILMEDLGDNVLRNIVTSGNEEIHERLFEKYGKDWVKTLFLEAIRIIEAVQRIPPRSNSLAFSRHTSFQGIRREAEEFINFYAEPKGMRASAMKEIQKALDGLCETVNDLPKRLSLYDFGAHNLIYQNGMMRVIDFQDAALTTPVRDVVSLLNDRGMDEILGKELHSQLLKDARERIGKDINFNLAYNLSLLHWDFRVTGRYNKLNRELNTSRYEQYIPGTLRRLGRTLLRSYSALHGFESVVEILSDFSSEIREGVSDPWDLPE